MKILYGVQGTGNGHISRANAMADAFKKYSDIEVTWLMSGREQALGCGDITNFLWREGMTFTVKDGKINLLSTLKGNNLFKFLKDAGELDIKPYDLIISDFEPVISRAARKRGVKITGIGHQYAFDFKIPKRGANVLTSTIMKMFAPVDIPVGLHWHHFGFPILPPILDIDIPELLPAVVHNKVLVYLPFENISAIIDKLKIIDEFEFYLYHPGIDDKDAGNIHTRAISRMGFKQDLLTTRQVICNSGFELISECLQLGKRILSKPLHGQMEQLSNAQALSELNYAEIVENFDAIKIEQWLQKDKEGVKIAYPDVASTLAQWISTGCAESTEELSTTLWAESSSSNNVDAA